MKTFYLESYGCSLNKSDSEKIMGLLEENNFKCVSLKKANIIIINTCAVKEQTENKMIKRIKELLKSKPKNSELIVFGCLSIINPFRVKKLAKKIVLIPPSLEELCNFLSLPVKKFSPKIKEKKFNPLISIIPISRGCVGNCSYCCVKSARGKLKSHSIESIKQKLKENLNKSKEFWLTAQDTGAFGKDLGLNLPELLKELIKVKGDYKIRIGMMNPQHLKEFYYSFISVFKSKHFYKFLHIPLQSGSNKILKKMNRKYSSQEFIALIKKLKKAFPSITISTDVIVGFPGETEKDFLKTVNVLKKISPNIVNISRFGARPNTKAATLKEQLHGRVKKARSRILTTLCKEIALKENKKLVGKRFEILISEKGKKGSFIGRTFSYKPVAVKSKKNLLGKKLKVKITKAFPTYFFAEIL